MPPPPVVNQSNPLLNYYEEFSNKTPYVTKVTMIWLLVAYLISWFIASDKVLANTPYFTVYNFEIYRLIFSPLVSNSIFNIVLAAMSFPALGAKMETSLGSGAFLVLLLTLSLITNIVFAVVCVVMYLFGSAEAIFYECSGFWLILFGLITMDCIQVRYLCIYLYKCMYI
jgi:membrane associated rhomboid family serine protease